MRALAGWILTALLLVPSAAAGVAYQGPGQQGAVPLGDGGHALRLLPALADNKTVVSLVGIPEDVCRFVLDDNATYAQTVAEWAPGSPVAHIWAEAPAVDAPFRVAAHWVTDVKGECTAEVTPDGTVWHDPRGRPFVELGVNETKSFWEGPAGTVFPFAVEVTNNGTLPAQVTAEFELGRTGWELRDASPTVDVPIDALETFTFRFDVYVPRYEAQRMNVLPVTLRAENWAERVLLFLDLQAPLPEEAAPVDTGLAPDGLEPWEPTPREAPGIPVPFVAIALLGLLFAARLSPGRRQDP